MNGMCQWFSGFQADTFAILTCSEVLKPDRHINMFFIALLWLDIRVWFSVGVSDLRGNWILKLGKVFTPTVFTNMLIVIGCVVYQL
jgi:hypothetical protein